MYFTKLTTLLSAIIFVFAAFLGMDHNSEIFPASDNLQTDEVTITGQLSGFDCAVVGVLCPTTHRGADYTTGVFTNDESFYFIVNIPQSFLQQHFRETVEIEGTVYPPYEKAVEPEKIHVVEDNDRRLVYEEGYFIDENNRRATFQNGEYRDGRWTASDMK